MKLHVPTKIIFGILAVLLVAAAVFLGVNYQKFKQPAAAGGQEKIILSQPLTKNSATSTQPSGTCAPDLANCQGSAELCMSENKAAVCSN